MPDVAMEERLQRIENLLALDDLVKRYFLASDDDDAATLSSLFDADAEFLVSGQSCARTPAGIIGFIVGERRKMGLTNHVLDGATYDFSAADTAAGLVRAHLELVYNGVAVHGAVRYQDIYVRRTQGWKLQRRDMRVLYLAPWNELSEALASPTPVRWPGAEFQPSDV